MIIPVILSGGSGTRLWPLSRKNRPKQFHALNSEQSLIQQTMSRIQKLLPESRTIVVCNDHHRFLVAEQLRQIGFIDKEIILEPVGRNTAPAIALAAIRAQQINDNDPVLLILPADHLIENIDVFDETIKSALKYAEAGQLVTFGIVPTSAETGYGYIQRGKQASNNGNAYMVESFLEKPDLEHASQYLESGNYFWNSGMFLFRAEAYLEELERFEPDMLYICKETMTNSHQDLDFIRLPSKTFEACKAISIDYAVMEHTDKSVVIPLDASWNDIGSWSALWETGDKDDEGNVQIGDVVVRDSRNCYVNSLGHMVALVGVDDLVIVDTPDALMVASREKVKNVKSIVDDLIAGGRSEALDHREVYRPWGKYDSIGAGERYQVKK
jgi:mannose-1-phosphate guanylyltransferase/mannose-6-phosphate isomerase